MNDVVSLTATGFALIVSVFSAYVAWSSLKTAQQATRAGHIQNLFAVNQAALQHPELLIDVHGIDPGTPEREARALVYLSMILDGFQVAHDRVNRGNFSRMAAYMKLRGDSLRRFLAVPANAARWDIVKGRSYGDFEPGFVSAVDDLIAFERTLTAENC
jgi:hypothetical protein